MIAIIPVVDSRRTKKAPKARIIIVTGTAMMVR
jgi:hypothetical protein